jgi:hypothetical protein
MLRRIFWSKRDEVAGSEKHYTMWSFMICTHHSILFGRSNRKEMGGACSMYGGRRGVYRVLVGKPKGRRPFETPRRRDQDVDGRIILRWIFRKCDVGHGLDLSGSAYGRVVVIVNAVIKLRVQFNAGNFLTRCETVSFSRSTLLHEVSK